MRQWNLSVCGCCLVDHVYPDIDFSSPAIRRLLSRTPGDGGLAIGKLVFAEDLQEMAGMNFDAILEQITGDSASGIENVGGPAIVGAVCTAQILHDKPFRVRFYGTCGNDEAGDFIRQTLSRTDVDMSHFATVSGATPCTVVLSDPRGHEGKGERTFINRIGSAAEMAPAFLDDGFFDADVLWFSATALTPLLHDSLGDLLRRGREAGKINVVSTVFDFRNEKKNPAAPWPLGDSDSWKDMDLLIVDCDEALRLTGTDTLDKACDFLVRSGVSSFFVTHGSKNFRAWSDGRFFLPSGHVYELPISAAVSRELAEHPERRGDTTGCGDNFAGGIVASLFLQIYAGKKPGELSLTEAAAWGASAGGAACFRIGGLRLERERGENYRMIARYADSYAKDSLNFSL